MSTTKQTVERRGMFVLICCLLLTLSWTASAENEIVLPSIFSDNMVLQRSKSIPIWGEGLEGETVIVEFNGQSKSTTVNKKGEWKLRLDAMHSSKEPRNMTVKVGEHSKTIKNILIGEVWVCSGQSNMEWAMKWGAVDNKKEEMANANYPQIRFINAPHVVSGAPRKTIGSKWSVCNPESAGRFSAVGYFFGRKLHKNLDMPIGLIGANWGGTSIELWTPPSGFRLVPGFGKLAQTVNWKNDHYSKDLEEKYAAIKAWVERVEKDKSLLTSTAPDMPLHKVSNYDLRMQPTTLYNGMLAPFIPYAIRGAIWYQGENNMGDGIKYAKKMEALVAGWRKEWGQGNFPFYFCQLAPFSYGNVNDDQLCSLWQAQYTARNMIKNCEMASTVDVGNPNNIHPTNKQDVGKRLALIALGNTYEQADVNWESPAFEKMKIENDKLILTFKNAVEGLKSKDGKDIREFKIAGSDGKFHPAKATVSGSTVTVSSSKVASPQTVKYAWRNGATPNLINSVGLPILPFKTEFNAFQGRKNHALNKPYKSSNHNSYGWHDGLTDGVISGHQNNCFATADSNTFPKSAVIDLENNVDIKTILAGVPNFGSTKTVEVSVSSDSKEFKTVGALNFKQGAKVEKKLVLKDKVNARYIKLNFPDKHSKQNGYNPNFIFLTEVMAFSD